MKTLDNIRVLDLSRFQSGPICGMMLGDMGAEVIRIEETTGSTDRKWGFWGLTEKPLPIRSWAETGRVLR